MSEEKLEATSIIYYVHGQTLTLNPAIGYVHGAITSIPHGRAVVTIERDDSGRVKIRIDKK